MPTNEEVAKLLALTSDVNVDSFENGAGGPIGNTALSFAAILVGLPSWGLLLILMNGFGPFGHTTGFAAFLFLAPLGLFVLPRIVAPAANAGWASIAWLVALGPLVCVGVWLISMVVALVISPIFGSNAALFVAWIFVNLALALPRLSKLIAPRHPEAWDSNLQPRFPWERDPDNNDRSRGELPGNGGKGTNRPYGIYGPDGVLLDADGTRRAISQFDRAECDDLLSKFGHAVSTASETIEDVRARCLRAVQAPS